MDIFKLNDDDRPFGFGCWLFQINELIMREISFFYNY